MFLDHPRGLRDPARVAERLGMLGVPTIQPLQEWATELHFRRRDIVPHFDPAGGGTDARALIVYESPGPLTNLTNGPLGSGFVSVDNDDPGAQHMWELHASVGPDQAECLHWNIVPWFLSPTSIRPTAAEVREGAAAMVDLLRLLPRLETVIACGMTAQRAWAKHVQPVRRDLHVIDTWHPSPLSLKQPGKREELQRALVATKRRLDILGGARAEAPAPSLVD